MSSVTAAQVRRHIVDALRADLVGPFAPSAGPDGDGDGGGDGASEAAEEVWDLAPSKRYLCSLLYVAATRCRKTLTVIVTG